MPETSHVASVYWCCSCSVVTIYGTFCVISHAKKGKGTIHPVSGREGPEGEKRYNSIVSFTSALDGCGWSTPRHVPAALTLGKRAGN